MPQGETDPARPTEAVRGHPLAARATRRNVPIGRRRGRVEAVSGALERSYGLPRMRFMGLARAAR